MKSSGQGTDWDEIDIFDGGIGWIAHPDETMQRASHALTVDGEVWLVDPVDADGIDERITEHGDVAGVVTLLDRHKRDAAAFANRHDVSVWVPEFIDGVTTELDAPIERFRHELAETGYAVHPLVENRLWQEAVLYDESNGVLVVPEGVGTTSYFRTANESLGVHPMLRLTPPRKLSRFDPARVLVGHGPGVHENATAALEDALDGSRRRAPQLLFKTVKDTLLG